jgi:hypothetical protein
MASTIALTAAARGRAGARASTRAGDGSLGKSDITVAAGGAGAASSPTGRNTPTTTGLCSGNAAVVGCGAGLPAGRLPASPYSCGLWGSGADRARTDDLLHAISPRRSADTRKRPYIEGFGIASNANAARSCGSLRPVARCTPRYRWPRRPRTDSAQNSRTAPSTRPRSSRVVFVGQIPCLSLHDGGRRCKSCSAHSKAPE